MATDDGVGLLGGQRQHDATDGNGGGADLGRCRGIGGEDERTGRQRASSGRRVHPRQGPRTKEVDRRRVGGDDVDRDTPGGQPVGGSARDEAGAGEGLTRREAGDEATTDGVTGIDDGAGWGAPGGRTRPDEVVDGEDPARGQLAGGEEDGHLGRRGRPQLVEHEEDARRREGRGDAAPHDRAPPPGTPPPAQEGGKGAWTCGHAATLGATAPMTRGQAERVDDAAAGAGPVDDPEDPVDPDDPFEPDDPLEPDDVDEPSPDDEDPDEPVDDPPSEEPDPEPDDPDEPLGTAAPERLSVR